MAQSIGKKTLDSYNVRAVNLTEAIGQSLFEACLHGEVIVTIQVREKRTPDKVTEEYTVRFFREF